MEMKDLLKQGITEALNKAIAAGTLPAGDYPDVALEVPPQKEFGDFASNIAMQSARVAHKAPRLIAQAIVDGMDYPWLDHAEIAGAVAGIFARLCIRGKLRADVACGVGREGDEVAAVQ